MKNYDVKNIRNILLVGSSGGGKTTLTEHMLFNAKMTSRAGRVEEGNTVSDFDQEEIEKRMSLSLSVAYADWKGVRINLLDSPGYPDFSGQLISGVAGVEAAGMVVNAAGAFDVGLEQAIDIVSSRDVSKFVIANRMDNEHADYSKVIEMIQENSDIVPAPLVIPVGREASFRGVIDLVKEKAFIGGKAEAIPAEMADEVEEYRMKLMESVAETNDDLLEKYFEEGELSHDELLAGIKAGIADGKVVPVFCCSAAKNIGVDELMSSIAEYLPSPADKKVIALEGGKEKTLQPNESDDLFAYVFRSFSDPNVGDMAYVRIFSGTLKSGSEVFVPEKDSKDKIGSMYYVMGKNRSDASELRPGEIGGLVKLKVARGFNTMVKPGASYVFPEAKLPSPVYWQSIKAGNQSDEDKIGAALAKILEESPTITSYFDPDTHEQIISGAGEQQIGMVQRKLRSRFKVEAALDEPRIPYRETITGNADVSYKHKKQSGGRGQYGEVYFRVKPKPRGEGFEFINAIVGGVIPSKFIPAIEKGLNEIMEKGILAGNKVVDISVECYFGSYHDVDSSEMAFKIASSQALKAGFAKANPILLEPIHEVQIVIPNEFMGDVMGDVSTRRGKILGMEQKGKKQILNAHMPLSELYGYFPALKSFTQGRGKFEQKFSHFEKVPNDIAQKVIAEHNDK